MDKIYAPWRNKYVTTKTKTKEKNHECVFCKIAKEKNDEKNYILKRNKHTFIILNLYPYNAGHVMVIPYEHKGNLTELTKQIRSELIEEVNFSIEAIKKILKPEAFNVGLNLGKPSGGGIPEHLHFHIVPRWSGDTNFMSVIAEAKPISSDLNEIYKKLKAEFKK